MIAILLANDIDIALRRSGNSQTIGLFYFSGGELCIAPCREGGDEEGGGWERQQRSYCRCRNLMPVYLHNTIITHARYGYGERFCWAGNARKELGEGWREGIPDVDIAPPPLPPQKEKTNTTTPTRGGCKERAAVLFVSARRSRGEN